MNNKSRIALAIAAAFGTSAMGASAQTSTVQIGGSLNMFYGIVNQNGGTAASTNQGKNHDNLSLSEPEIWIHGEEKIGSMTAWFRCTSSFDLMGTSVSAGATAGQWCGRNSAMGFKGNFGNVFFGTWDTPAKLVGNAVRGWWGGTASLTGGFANMLYSGAGSNTGNTGATFWERRARTINYHSPNFSGFNFKAQYSAANERTLASSATTQALTPRNLGLALEYANGPLYVGLGWEQHRDFNPSKTVTAVSAGGATTTISTTTLNTPSVGAGALQYNGGTDNMWVIGARYQFAFGTRLSGLYTKTRYDVSNSETASKAGWAIFVDHKLSGPHSIKGQFFKAGDTKGNAVAQVTNAPGQSVSPVTVTRLGQHQFGPATGGKGWSLAYMYQMSKRTEAGFVYGLIDNDTNATYSKGVTTAPAGSTQKMYGLNVRHRF